MDSEGKIKVSLGSVDREMVREAFDLVRWKGIFLGNKAVRTRRRNGDARRRAVDGKGTRGSEAEIAALVVAHAYPRKYTMPTFLSYNPRYFDCR